MPYRVPPWPWGSDPITGDPDFTEVEIEVKPEGDRFRLTMVDTPTGRVITSDYFEDEWSASARAQDFVRICRSHAPNVRVHSRFRRAADPEEDDDST
jgi:hypothetical protein